MVRGARWLYAGLSWAFLAGLVVQVFFIGLALFAARENIELHVSFGYLLHLSPILLLVAGAVARAGRTRLLWTVGLAVVVFVVPLVTYVRDSAPAAAALHPVLALLAFWLAITVARGATAALREPDIAGTTAEAGV